MVDGLFEIEPVNEYARKMKKFFAVYDSMRDVPSAELPKVYARYFWQHGSRGRIVGLPAAGSINNLSIASNGQNLGELTRRIQLISDVSMFTHFRERKHHFYSFSDDVPQPGAPGISQECYIRCRSMSELGQWLIDCRPLLEAGDVFYYPDIFVEQQLEYFDGFEDDTPKKRVREPSIANLCDVLVKNGKIVDQVNGPVKKIRTVYPMLRIDLPFIDQVSMSTYASMSLDYRDALNRARDALRGQFLSLDDTIGSEKLETSLARVTIELRESVREIDSTYRAIRRTAAFSYSGASIGSVTAVLALSSTFAPAVGIIGGAGGLLAVARALESHLESRHKLQDRSYYFLWLLMRKARDRRR